MRFAIDKEGKRILPCKGGRGFCPLCEKEVYARRGSKRTAHWAHKPGTDCAYSEYTRVHETPWHINWKNNFPTDWHEVVRCDEISGEKHIADVRTPYDLTIEFQHSPISDEERISREQFYSSIGRMIWVVDGTKNKDTWKKYHESSLLRTCRPDLPENVTITEHAKTFLPEEWLQSAVPVFFDFTGSEPETGATQNNNELICILCSKGKTKHLFIPIKKERFIDLCSHRKIFSWIKANTPQRNPESSSPAPSVENPISTPKSQNAIQRIEGGIRIGNITVRNVVYRKKERRF